MCQGGVAAVGVQWAGMGSVCVLLLFHHKCGNQDLHFALFKLECLCSCLCSCCCWASLSRMRGTCGMRTGSILNRNLLNKVCFTPVYALLGSGVLSCARLALPVTAQFTRGHAILLLGCTISSCVYAVGCLISFSMWHTLCTLLWTLL